MLLDSGENEGMSLSRCVTGWMTESPPAQYSVDMALAGLVTLATELAKSMCQQLGASGDQGGLWGPGRSLGARSQDDVVTRKRIPPETRVVGGGGLRAAPSLFGRSQSPGPASSAMEHADTLSRASR